MTEEELGSALGRFAASSEARNPTLEAIARAWPADPEPADDVVPFLSRRRWSGLRIGGVRYVLGAPELFALGELAALARERPGGRPESRRLRRHRSRRSRTTDGALAAVRPLGLAVLAEELRAGDARDDRVSHRAGRRDRRALGRFRRAPSRRSRQTPASPSEGRRARAAISRPTISSSTGCVAEIGVVGRISPEGKRRVVESLRRRGRYVAMVGDGVNDVPALKASRLSIAQGSGTQMAKAVSDVVLVNGDFAAVPAMVAEGRRVLRNIQRVTKLFVTKSVFAAFLIVAIGITPAEYPAAAAPSDHRRHADGRDPRVLPRARPERRAVAHRRLPARGRPLLGARRGRRRARA